VNELVTRPSVLAAIPAPKAWGWELWLTSTRSEAAAQLHGGPGTLSDLIARHPEVLGAWTRSLFGDQMPIFAKFIHTDFPKWVHLGFRRAISREEFLGWLEREQDLMRRLLAALRIVDAQAFADYHSRYSAWAAQQALARWQRDDDAAAASLFGDLIDASFDLPSWLASARANRAKIVDALNEVDLKRESGHLLLTSAGCIHGIFGLSHQTHPLDRSRPALQALFRVLAERHASGASDGELARLVELAGLPSLRAENVAPPKNEGWLATSVDGADVLVEPQQTSDTTYSLADFYTPLTWGGDRVRFRKGSPTHGLSRDELATYLDSVHLSVTPIESVRRIPKHVAGASRKGAELFCLVDEPQEWPFFTAYQLELSGKFRAAPPPGIFQELVVTRGRVELSDDKGVRGELSPHAPGFVPATLVGSYTLAAREPSTVLILGMPSARGSGPVIGGT
jgi:hypothetical protein